MINTRLAYLEPKSSAKISTAMSLIGSIIAMVISVIAMILLVSYVPQLKTYVSNNISLFLIFGIVIGLLITLIFNYLITYINVLLYNYLLKYFKGIQFELTPYNEIKEIDILSTLSITLIIAAIWFIIMGIILFLTFSAVVSILSHVTSVFSNLNIATIATTSLVIVTSIILLSLVIFAIMFIIIMFIFNFFSKRNPLKLEITEDNGLELKSVDVMSYVMSIGLTLLTIQLIRTLINIMVGGSMEVALLSIVNTIATCLIVTAAVPYIYNFVASKIGGLKFDIEPSSNMIQEYPITNNLPEYDIQ